MPLVAHNQLPAFDKLRHEGLQVLEERSALQQDIRELHIGLLNMMPDAALTATERQFFRMIGGSNLIVQIYVHPFTLQELPRGEVAQEHIARYYESLATIQEHGLDALIITGASVTQPQLHEEPFWEPFKEVVGWAWNNVSSTLFSCQATHALMQWRYGQQRYHLGEKRWGIFKHAVVDACHPLVSTINTHFDVPHSRYNEISRAQYEAAGLRILVESEEAGVHLAVSPDGFRQVLFQGHPEYDRISLLKEYKREVVRYVAGERDYPVFPNNYFGLQTQAILEEFGWRLRHAAGTQKVLQEFPEPLVSEHLHNTWHDSAVLTVANWIGLVYQITNRERAIPFMQGVDPNNPLGHLNIKGC